MEQKQRILKALATIKIIFGSIAIISLFSIIIGIILLIWLGVIGLKIFLTGLILFIVFYNFYKNTEKEIEIQKRGNYDE